MDTSIDRTAMLKAATVSFRVTQLLQISLFVAVLAIYLRRSLDEGFFSEEVLLYAHYLRAVLLSLVIDS